MAKKYKGTDEELAEATVYSHEDMVKFKAKYSKNWPEKKPKHLKEGEVYTMHEKMAKTLSAKGIGEIVEYLNDKRDKSFDKTNVVGEPKVTKTSDVKNVPAEKGPAAEVKKDEKK